MSAGPSTPTREGPSTERAAGKITVDDEHAGRRLDKFLRSQLKGVPAGLLFRLLRQGKLRVNGRKTQQDYRIQDGDIIDVPELRVDDASAPARRLPSSLIEQMRNVILYEDQDLLIINKPAGVAVHKGTDVPGGVIEALRQLRPELPELELIHRLDRDTSGVLALAKTPSILRYLHDVLRDREDEIERHYLAIVAGNWLSGATALHAPLQRRDTRVVVDAGGQRAETHVSVRRRVGNRATILNIRLLTGRKHQIRVHLQHAGHPIAGDDRYGDQNFNSRVARLGGAGLFLHAAKMVIPMPDGTDRVVTAPTPMRWEQLLKAGL
ncbi:RluA family pseudouridine synthase [Tomitella biformata]|uniref:RluA family pseudouridine synthase n=1 Tax=Tomitella biformata TaxID=630403 RepID=UPI000465BC23|nr:RluA family pseudouridine synthase [Tomitella biformata]